MIHDLFGNLEIVGVTVETNGPDRGGANNRSVDPDHAPAVFARLHVLRSGGG